MSLLTFIQWVHGETVAIYNFHPFRNLNENRNRNRTISNPHKCVCMFECVCIVLYCSTFNDFTIYAAITCYPVELLNCLKLNSWVKNILKSYVWVKLCSWLFTKPKIKRKKNIKKRVSMTKHLMNWGFLEHQLVSSYFN